MSPGGRNLLVGRLFHRGYLKVASAAGAFVHRALRHDIPSARDVV
jgi:hypothetical protein